jgi:hypothetical protein
MHPGTPGFIRFRREGAEACNAIDTLSVSDPRMKHVTNVECTHDTNVNFVRVTTY